MKTILLADDEPHLRTLVTATLDGDRYRIVEAPDGPTAVALARSECPDLVLLDWMMPDMTGLDVAQALRALPETAAVPIIFLTAKGRDADRAAGLAAGACAYLVKPFSPLELLARVEEVLG